MNIFVRKDENVRVRRRGFTLVEAPVVIAFIALLVSILLPPWSKAKERAKCVKTQSNLKQLALAMRMYEADFGYLPTSMSALEKEEYVDSRLIGEPQGDEHYLREFGYDYHYLYPPEQLFSWSRQTFDGTSSSVEEPSETVIIRVTGGCNGHGILAYLDGHVGTSRDRDGIDVVALHDAAVGIMAAQSIYRIVRLAADEREGNFPNFSGRPHRVHVAP